MQKSHILTHTVLGLLGIVALSGCTNSNPSQSTPSLSVGTDMPTLQTEGWLNGSGLTNADLQGKVVVVECFAYW